MAETAVEVDAAGFDGVEDLGFADETRAVVFGCFRCGAFGRADDADPEVGFHRVREAEAVADHGAVFGRAEAEVEFVFA